MSIDVIRETTQKARKEYYDDGYEWIREFLDNRGYMERGCPKQTIADYRLLIWVKRNNKEAQRIYPGQQYVSQFNVCDGTPGTFRTKKIFHDLCVRLKLYPTDI